MRRNLNPIPNTLLIFLLLLTAADFSEDIALASKSEDVVLTTYSEPYQKAFNILIPKGWKAEGGMIPSGVTWNVVDLVENNIRFRVTSPDGKSFFGWYPRFYFQDPQVIAQSSGGMLQPQIGQVLNGCWIYPYLDVAQYARHIVFNQFAVNEFQDPKIIGSFIRSPELEPFVPKIAFSSLQADS